MDNQDTLRNVLIAGAVFIAVLYVAPQLLPPSPTPSTPSRLSRSGSKDNKGQGETREPSAAASRTQGGRGSDRLESPTSEANKEVHKWHAVEAQSEQTRVMGTVSSRGGVQETTSPYRMRLTLSNMGAAIESATMSDHAQSVGSDTRYTLLRPVEQDDGTRYRSLAVEKVNIDGTDLILFDKKWRVGAVRETNDGQELQFGIDVEREGKPVLKITRTYHLPRQPRELGRHDLNSIIRVENVSSQPHDVLVALRGGVGVQRTGGSRMDDRYIDWGIFDPQVGDRVVVSGKRHANVTHDNGTLALYAPSRSNPQARLSWAATANTYFTCTIALLTHDGRDNPAYVADVSAVDLDGSPLTDDDTTLRFVTAARTMAPGADTVYPADVYLGEKDGDAFRRIETYQRRNYYAQISQRFGWCTFNWLVELMIWLLNGLYHITHDYGVAIIILVLVVRILLHPITKKGQVNMVRMQHRMQEMAPKIEEIKKKYANDKLRMNQEMMKLNINPAGQLVTCLPMMIQMPIWVALYLSLSNNILMRHEPLHFTWIHDMTAPDALYTFASPIIVPGVGWVLPAFNLLPLLLAVFMYTQQKLQPKPAPNPNMTDQQRQQQDMMKKMMPLMSFMMLFFFYKAPSGLNLYIMCSSLFGTIEQARIRKHIKQQEAAGTLHKKTATKSDDPVGGSKKTGKPSFFERLQKMADEAHKTPTHRPDKRKVRR